MAYSTVHIYIYLFMMQYNIDPWMIKTLIP